MQIDVADSLTPEERSKRMSLVRSSGNKVTELRLMKIFRESNITGCRRAYALPGKLDFVFPKQRVAVLLTAVFGTDADGTAAFQSRVRNFGFPSSKEIANGIVS